jgi:hypothetical protein
LARVHHQRNSLPPEIDKPARGDHATALIENGVIRRWNSEAPAAKGTGRADVLTRSCKVNDGRVENPLLGGRFCQAKATNTNSQSNNASADSKTARVKPMVPVPEPAEFIAFLGKQS